MILADFIISSLTEIFVILQCVIHKNHKNNEPQKILSYTIE